MSGRTVRRFVDGLLRGQRTERARPDDFEAEEMKTAIELRAARTGSDSPREEFVTDLHRRLAEQMGDAPQTDGRSWGPSGTRRQVVIGTGLAAASAATGIVVGRNLLRSVPRPAERAATPQGVLEPNAGTWHAVGASADLPDGGALAFDLGSVSGFVHRVRRATGGGLRHLHASGLQALAGCAGSRLRCPCHSTSFSLEGKTLTHQTADGTCAAAEVRGA